MIGKSGELQLSSPEVASSREVVSSERPSKPPSAYQALFDSIPQSGLKCDILFLVIRNRIQEEPDYVRRLRVVFQFNITKDAQPAATWTCDTKSSLEGDIYRSAPKAGIKADCILTVDDDDWVRIMVGKLNPQRAFMMSKFKVRGNIMLLQKLHAVWFDLRRKGKTPELDLIQEIMVNEPLLAGLKSEAMSIEIVQRIVKMPHLVDQINAIIQIDILKEMRVVTQYQIALRPGRKPEFKRMSGAKQAAAQLAAPLPVSDVKFTVEDDDLVLIIYGLCSVQEAIESGKLLVEGRRDVAERAWALLEQPPIMSKL